MTLTRSVAFVLLSLAVTLSLYGCGGCQGGDEKTSSEAAKPKAAVEQPPAGKPVVPTPPVADADQMEADCFVIVDAEPDFGGPPLEVKFEPEIDCTAQPVTYSWDFGDGTAGGNEAHPTHIYTTPGDFVAVVTTKSPDGGEGEDEIDITVDPEMDE
jgi:PKD repeat protein